VNGTGLIDIQCPLEEIELSECSIDDKSLAVLKRIPTLRQLRIGQTFVLGPGLAALAGSNLEGIDLSRTLITDEGLKHLQDLPRLRWIHLHGCNISTSSVAQLQRFSALRNVGLDQRLADSPEYGQLDQQLMQGSRR